MQPTIFNWEKLLWLYNRRAIEPNNRKIPWCPMSIYRCVWICEFWVRQRLPKPTSFEFYPNHATFSIFVYHIGFANFSFLTFSWKSSKFLYFIHHIGSNILNLGFRFVINDPKIYKDWLLPNSSCYFIAIVSLYEHKCFRYPKNKKIIAQIPYNEYKPDL